MGLHACMQKLTCTADNSILKGKICLLTNIFFSLFFLLCIVKEQTKVKSAYKFIKNNRKFVNYKLNLQSTLLIVQLLIAKLKLYFGQPHNYTFIKISVPRQVFSCDGQKRTMSYKTSMTFV